MAQKSIFFNSAPNDVRKYQASDFAEYFGTVLSTGLVHTNETPALEVKCEGNDLRTYVKQGRAIMQGYGYVNTSNEYLQHSIPEPSLDRIDRIVLRLDKRNQSRFIRLFVKEGLASENPTPPSLQRDEFIYELSLARITVRANTSTLNPNDLVDERLNEDLCGLVNSMITVPTSQFQQQWDDFISGIQDEGFATNQRVDGLESDVVTHKAEDASLTQKGHVQLTNSVTSENETLAATAKAVKTAMDRADAAFTSANEGRTAVANAVTAKGVSASPSDTFPTLASRIGQIPTGAGTLDISKGTLATNNAFWKGTDHFTDFHQDDSGGRVRYYSSNTTQLRKEVRDANGTILSDTLIRTESGIISQVTASRKDKIAYRIGTDTNVRVTDPNGTLIQILTSSQSFTLGIMEMPDGSLYVLACNSTQYLVYNSSGTFISSMSLSNSYSSTQRIGRCLAKGVGIVTSDGQTWACFHWNGSTFNHSSATGNNGVLILLAANIGWK